MKLFFTLLIFCLTGSANALAEGDYLTTQEPICTTLTNEAPYNVIGTVATNSFVRPDGIKTYHRSNFRLATDEGIDICSYGPFYPGYRLEITLRTLIPVFSCKTTLNEPLIISGYRKEEGGAETWVNCS